MSFYTRAGEVAQRNWHRLLKALRVQFGALQMYEVNLPMETASHHLLPKRDYPLASIALLGESVTVVEPNVAPLTIAEEPMEFSAEVQDIQDDREFNPEIHSWEIVLSQTTIVASETRFDTKVYRLNISTTFDPAVYESDVTLSDSSVTLRRMMPVGSQTKVNSNMSFLLKQPIRRFATPLKTLSTEVKINYWKQILAALQKPSSDLKFVGVFKNVPRQGIERAKVEPGSGILQLWLDPKKKKRATAGTLLIARDIKENKIYQVFAR